MAPLRQLDHYDVVDTERGIQKLSDMKLVITDMIAYLLTECGEEVKQKYKKGNRQIVPLTKLFQICKIIYLKGNSKRRVEQMSWESFVKDAGRLKQEWTNIGKVNQQQNKQVQSKIRHHSFRAKGRTNKQLQKAVL